MLLAWYFFDLSDITGGCVWGPRGARVFPDGIKAASASTILWPIPDQQFLGSWRQAHTSGNIILIPVNCQRSSKLTCL
ncbi:hypothetical protein AMECASPLE_036357 [Ameca splendens]|uniref:Uncharacterized protein n=1 Tax=Ameca splendens TaxID=208324 RepID=A0ABV0ZGD9_9TELE